MLKRTGDDPLPNHDRQLDPRARASARAHVALQLCQLPRSMSLPRARVVTMNAALGPLDYRVPDGMRVEPGSVVVAPLGPRQLLGVAWEAERLPSEEVPTTAFGR